MNKHRFVWHDLNTKDVEGSKRFYGEIFNWKLGSSNNGPYLHISAGDEMIGGVRQEKGMPSFADVLSTDDLRLIQAYVVQRVHEAQRGAQAK